MSAWLVTRLLQSAVSETANIIKTIHIRVLAPLAKNKAIMLALQLVTTITDYPFYVTLLMNAKGTDTGT